MITENEIRNQYAIAQSHKDNPCLDKEDRWSLYGYIHALGYVLGTLKSKYDKEDI